MLTTSRTKNNISEYYALRRNKITTSSCLCYCFCHYDSTGNRTKLEGRLIPCTTVFFILMEIIKLVAEQASWRVRPCIKMPSNHLDPRSPAVRANKFLARWTFTRAPATEAIDRRVLTRNLWFSARRGAKVVQNFSMSALMSPDPLITSMNFFRSGASFIATCNQLNWS